jgi:CDP-diacylglycerol--inositol 3-phosphatidyltransferase
MMNTREGINRRTNDGRKRTFFERHDRVLLFIPNVIGYARLTLMLISFYLAKTDPTKTVVLYLLSFICDELDGRFARMFDQCTEFGAVLDMVTDRLATTGLLIILSEIYSSSSSTTENEYYFNAQFLCILLICVDIASHWIQMHSQLACGKLSHKDMSKSRFWLLRLYYQNRVFMGVCCVSTEVLYLSLYMVNDKDGLALMKGLIPIKYIVSIINSADGYYCYEYVNALFSQKLKIGSIDTWPTQFLVLAIPGFLLKQIANVAQLRSAIVQMVQNEPKFALKRSASKKKK